MSDSVSVARQATFNTEPGGTGTSSGRGIRRGELKIPVIEGVIPPDNDNHRPSLASSSGHSSPIYANGDANLKKYRLEALNNSNNRATTRQGKPSAYYSESDLDILSDVGLAGDSDTEAPPSLSISARKKLRKEPRIKVPSSKFDSTESPIQEESTQEILANRSPETDTDLFGAGENSRRPSNLSNGSSKRKKNVSFDTHTRTVNITPREDASPNRKSKALSPTAQLKESQARQRLLAKNQRSPDSPNRSSPLKGSRPDTANKLTSTDADKRGVNLNPDPIEPELDDLDSDFWKPTTRARKDRSQLSKSPEKDNRQGRKVSPENKVNGAKANPKNPEDNFRGKEDDKKRNVKDDRGPNSKFTKGDQIQPKKTFNGDSKDHYNRPKNDNNSSRQNVNGKNRDSVEQSKNDKNLPRQTSKENSKDKLTHSDPKKGGVQNNSKNSKNSPTTDKGNKANEVNPSRVSNKDQKVTSPQRSKTQDLDSSFCESDWQPRNKNPNEKPENSKRLTKNKNQTNKAASNEDNGNGKQTFGKNTAQQDKVKKESNSSSRESIREGDEKKKEPSSTPSKGGARDKENNEKEKRKLAHRSQTYLKVDEPSEKGEDSRRDSRERSQESLTNSQKLVEEDKKEISHEYKTKVQNDPNLRVEGKEKDQDHSKTDKTISRDEKLKTASGKNGSDSQPDSKVSSSEKSNRSPNQKQDSKNLQRDKTKTVDSHSPGTPPASSAAINMATSDGYDYESETFEEVLKERNAMVKTERTYQRRIKQLEEELKGMVHECQKLSDENKELRQTLEDPKKSRDKDKDADGVDMATRIANLETEKENLVKTNETLGAKLRENETKMKQWDSVFLENTRLKNKKTELDKKVQDLEKQLGYASDRMKESDTDKESRIQSAKSKNRELEAKVLNVQDENKSLKDKVKSLENDKAAVSTALEEKRTELNEVMKAMQNETTTETELKESKDKLEKAQSEVSSVKQELEELKNMLKASEESKEKLQNSLVQKDNEVRKMRVDHDNKDKVIVDLRTSVDRNRNEIQKYEQEKEGAKEMEKETLALKSRIGSLKAEIESSLNENQKLKQDREAMTYELERLRQENVHSSDAVAESKKYFRKWETEKEFRNKAEAELARKDEEVKILDTRLKEAGNRINVLHSRVKVLEDEKAHLLDMDLQTIENNNRILTDENAKLRKKLVERNIELTNKSTEQLANDSRLQLLERKQKDAEVRVRQLSGWVGNFDGDEPLDNNFKSTASTNKRTLPLRSLNNSHPRNPTRTSNDQRLSHRTQNEKLRHAGEPQVAYVSPRSNKTGGKKNPRSTMTPPLGWDKPNASYMDGNEVNHTPTSLPSIFDAKSMTPPDPHGGYFTLYKEKLKRMKERKF